MPRFFSRILSGLAALVLCAGPLAAACSGQNLIDALSAAERAALQAATDAQLYPAGNFWRATKAGATIHMVGTYHLDDPRHSDLMETLTPLIEGASTVLVEAGPEEEEALLAQMARDPSVLFSIDGPTLPEQLPKAEWDLIVTAMRNRGVPPFLAAKYRPWFLAVTLGIPACAMAEAATARGLDGRVIEAAQGAGVPVAALEPFDTVFTIFEDLTPEDQIAMIRSSLAMEAQAEDFSVTLADAYFREEGRLIWEFMRLISADLPGYTPERLDTEFAQMEEVLMSRRNREWIPVLTATADRGPVFAAFGALHLSGADGILALLERDGWTLERLPL